MILSQQDTGWRERSFVMGVEVGKQSTEVLLEDLRRDRDSLWHILFEQSRDGIVVLDLQGRVFEANRQFADMLDYSVNEVRAMHVWDWDARFSRAELTVKLHEIDGSGHQFETRQVRRDGKIIDVELSNSATVFKGQKLIFCICRDITERKVLEQEIYRYATTDNLTGLFNRHSFAERLGLEMELASRHGAPLSLIMYDFDRFKSINDEFGHAAGDQVLQQSAVLVRENVRCSDMVVRWGGEEFMILAPHTGLDDARLLAEKLRKALASHCFDERFRVTASFGVAEYVPDDSGDRLLKRVDDALYRAKHSGRNRVELAEYSEAAM